jgi:uncharacterized protein
MMKRLFALLVPFLLISSCKAQQQNSDKTLLWRISGKDLKAPSYLFGTIHMLCPDDYIWTEAMKKSLAGCKQVCFELDMDDPSVLMSAATGMMSAADKKLQDYFTPEQWTRLSRFMKDSVGTDLSQMQMMKPMVLESILASKTVSCAIPVSYEANIMEQAQRAKQTIVGLEEVDEQIAVFNSLPDDTVVASLMQMTDSFAESKAEYAKMIAAYKAQDLPGLYQQVRSSKELGDNLGTFLDERNQKWVPRMTKMMAQPTFFAVGAGHLWGTEGVISLLRKAGYTVTPVH